MLLQGTWAKQWCQGAGDRLLTRILDHSTFSDELWLGCFWTYDFQNYSVPCILMESQRRDKPLGKLVGKVMTAGRESEGLMDYCVTKPQQWEPQVVRNDTAPLVLQRQSSCCSRIPLCTLAETKSQLVGAGLCAWAPSMSAPQRSIQRKGTKQLSQNSPKPAPGCSFSQE